MNSVDYLSLLTLPGGICNIPNRGAKERLVNEIFGIVSDSDDSSPSIIYKV